MDAVSVKSSSPCSRLPPAFKTYMATGEVCCDAVNQRFVFAWSNVSQGC